jgi:hypothetical protein
VAVDVEAVRFILRAVTHARCAALLHSVAGIVGGGTGGTRRWTVLDGLTLLLLFEASDEVYGGGLTWSLIGQWQEVIGTYREQEGGREREEKKIQRPTSCPTYVEWRCM